MLSCWNIGFSDIPKFIVFLAVFPDKKCVSLKFFEHLRMVNYFFSYLENSALVDNTQKGPR